MTTSNRAARRRSLPPIALFAALLVALTAAACSSTPAPTGSPGASGSPGPSATPGPTAAPLEAGPLVSVETRGGHCIGGTCGETIVLDTDGTVRTAAKPPNELGTVPATDVAGMADLIAATDFAALRSHPSTGTCPVAFDGQEIVYEFTTSNGVERIESCVTEVDPKSSLFAAVAGVLVDFIVLPTE